MGPVGESDAQDNRRSKDNIARRGAFGNMTRATAAAKAGSRRNRHKKGRGRRTWLNAWPALKQGSNAAGNKSGRNKGVRYIQGHQPDRIKGK